MNRSVRLSYLQRSFYRNPKGYSAGVLAELCEVLASAKVTAEVYGDA